MWRKRQLPFEGWTHQTSKALTGNSDTQPVIHTRMNKDDEYTVI